MIKHQDGTITEIPYFKAATMPRNVKQQDTLLNATQLSNDDRELLVKILESCIATYE